MFMPTGGCSSGTTQQAHVIEVETGFSAVFDVEQLPLRKRSARHAVSTTIGFLPGIIESPKESLTTKTLVSADAPTRFPRIRPDDEDPGVELPEINYSTQFPTPKAVQGRRIVRRLPARRFDDIFHPER